MTRRVSILMPVKNGVEFLAESIGSVEAQTYPNWELLIGINNLPRSAPARAEIQRFARRRVRVFDLGETTGVYEARNHLAALASGDLICPLDVDDAWHPDKLAKQVPLIREQDVVGTWCMYFGDREGQPPLPAGEIAPENLFEANPLIDSSVLLRHEDAEWEPRSDGLGDYALWLRLAALRRRMYNVPEILTRHRVHSCSAYNTRQWDVAGLLRIWEPRLQPSDHYQTIQSWDLIEEIYDRGLDQLRDGDTVVEVGVWKGRSLCYLGEQAKRLGRRIQIVAVDPFEITIPYYQSFHVDCSYLTEFEENIRRQGIDHMVSIVKKTSVAAAAEFADHALGMVFLDGDHSYEAVAADLRAWYPKVRPGGLLAGHDYSHAEVARAVHEFADTAGLPVRLSADQDPCFYMEVLGQRAELPSRRAAAEPRAVLGISAEPESERSRRGTFFETYVSHPLPITAELRATLPVDQPWVIVDAGSCEGEDALRYARLFPHATIYAFEPVPRNVARLHRALAEFEASNIAVVPLALSDNVAWAPLHLSSGQPPEAPRPGWDFGNKSSSLLPPGQTLTTEYPWLRFSETITVPTDTLASFCRARGIRHLDFLHLKVQGHELRVLEGAGDLITTLRGVWLAVAERAMYVGQPHAVTVDRWFRQRGFAWVTERRDAPSAATKDRLYIKRSVSRLIIGALSGQEYHERRENCRATWMADVRRHPGLDAVFLLGTDTSPAGRVGDELHLPCADAYATLPQRTRQFCRWALESQQFDYLFKCDDDTYVAVDRLAAIDLCGRDYVGRDLGGWASGGAGYFLSRRAAEIVASELTAETGDEDCAVADVLRTHGITVADDPRFLPWPGSGEFPRAANRTITAHGINTGTWREIHAAVHGPGGLRIVMPTSNRHAGVAAISLELLDRYWPDHPAVDVIHHEVPAPTVRAERQFYAGPQGRTAWCDAFAKYLGQVNEEELLLIMLDDYALCGPVQDDLIDRARALVASDPRVAAFYLTWIQLPASRPYDRADRVLVCPPWDYTVHLQAGIWRRSSLVRILSQLRGASCESFEITGSDIQNQLSPPELHLIYDLPTPAHPSQFLDSTEKTYWPIPYHNLMRRGSPDPRHAEFLAREGFGPLV